jgi:small nuclear ribonucleoprotein (snRNP)-like protein
LELSNATMLSSDKNLSFVIFFFKMMLASATTAFTNYRETKLVASDKDANAQFGKSVALEGDTVVAGAHRDDGGGVTDAGAVYIFKRSGTLWSEEAKLVASDKEASVHFGSSMALEGDTVVVGAVLDDEGGVENAGAVYIFKRSGTLWSEEGKLVASDKDTNAYLGRSVALEGDTVVAGAWSDDGGDVYDAGAVYIFKRSGTLWSEEAKLVASDKEAVAHFGSSVSLKGDTVVAGAVVDDGGGVTDAGAVYIFKRSGTLWSEEGKLVASDKDTNAEFGSSVALKGDTVVADGVAASEYSDEDPDHYACNSSCIEIISVIVIIVVLG